MDVVKLTERWAEPAGPGSHIVVTSRVRHARNLERVAFPPRAAKEDLRRVSDSVDRLLRGNVAFTGFARIDISACSSIERSFLKESHIISPELEQGGEYRVLHLDQRRSCAIMVNEEDHLRMYCLRSGLQLQTAFDEINAIDTLLGRSLNYAYSEKYGFLTTCPSNVGTGMRASVLLHLPALAMGRQMDEIVKTIPQLGLTVRGYHGENSEFLGDFYQLSNEVTLGRTEEEILEELVKFIERLIAREEAARHALFEKKRWYVEDVIWRSYGVLTQARLLSSKEAFKLLSPVRLGIDQGFFPLLTHHRFNSLIVAIQPAHLQLVEGGELGVEQRGIARARFLRDTFGSLTSRN